MKMQIIKVEWLSPGSTIIRPWPPRSLPDPIIGIVIAEDPITRERKTYIGIGQGNSEGTDTDIIIARGGRINADRLREILAAMGPEEQETPNPGPTGQDAPEK